MDWNTQYELNKGLAQMLKGGVIMDVTTPEQAKIAEEAGACLRFSCAFLMILQQYNVIDYGWKKHSCRTHR